MKTIRDFYKDKISVTIRNKKDWSRFLKLASQKHWHWLAGQSAYGLKIEDSDLQTKNRVEWVPLDGKIGFRLAHGIRTKGYNTGMSLDTFIEYTHMSPDKRVSEEKEVIAEKPTYTPFKPTLSWLYENQISIEIRNARELRAFRTRARKLGWKNTDNHPYLEIEPKAKLESLLNLFTYPTAVGSDTGWGPNGRLGIHFTYKAHVKNIRWFLDKFKA